MNAVLRPILYLVDEEPERLSLLKQAGERCGEFSEIRAVMDAHLVYQELLDRANGSPALQVLVIAHWQTSNVAGAGLACALRAHRSLKDISVIAVSRSPVIDQADALACGYKALFRKPVGLPGSIALLRRVSRAYGHGSRRARAVGRAKKGAPESPELTRVPRYETSNNPGLRDHRFSPH